METISPPSRPSSASELIELAKQTVRAQSPEVPTEPTPTAYTIDDYVDSLEDVKRARRFVAKAYERTEAGRMEQDGLTATEDRQIISKNRPKWEEHFPKDDSPQEQARWDEFVLSFKDGTTQDTLRYLNRVSKKHDAISSDPAIQLQKEQYAHEQLEIMAAAAGYRALEREEKAIAVRIESLHARAATMGESSWHDTEQTQLLERQLVETQEARKLLLTSEKAVEEITRRRQLDAKRQFEKGVLMTSQLSEVERKNIPALLAGQPLLLVGETGGAKTALARQMAQEVLDLVGKSEKSPEVISGFAEINTYQLMGKNELRGNETVFMPGPLVRAMQEGRPVILDEVNAMPSEILKRLNIIMQLRPGDNYEIQEDSGMSVTIQPGFCIIATMNEKSHRYRGVESLSSEFKDRFGVNVAQISYPDQDVPPGGDTIPPTLLQLALLCCTDPNTGKIQTKHMSIDELLRFVRVTHFTQYMYTHLADDSSLSAYSPTDRAVDASSGVTGLSKSVISPRTMVQIINKVEEGMGRISLQETLTDFLGGLEDKTDRAIIQKLIEDYKLTQTTNGSQPT